MCSPPIQSKVHLNLKRSVLEFHLKEEKMLKDHDMTIKIK